MMTTKEWKTEKLRGSKIRTEVDSLSKKMHWLPNSASSTSKLDDRMTNRELIKS